MQSVMQRGVGMDFLDRMLHGMGAHVSTGIGSILGALILYTAAQTGRFIRGYMKRNSVEYQIEKAIRIQELLTQARLQWGAERVYIFQFSNGTYYANQVSQLNMTCTHQSVAAGVAPIGEPKKEYLISQYPEMLSDFLAHKCMVKDINEIDYPTMKTILKSQGVQTFLATSFSCRSNPNKIEGFVGIDFMTKDKSQIGSEVCNELSGFAERIGEELRG